jgi:hypothetical protein
MIVKEGNVHYFKQKVQRKVHVNTASYEDKKQFKKEHTKY